LRGRLAELAATDPEVVNEEVPAQASRAERNVSFLCRFLGRAREFFIIGKMEIVRPYSFVEDPSVG